MLPSSQNRSFQTQNFAENYRKMLFFCGCVTHEQDGQNRGRFFCLLHLYAQLRSFGLLRIGLINSFGVFRARAEVTMRKYLPLLTLAVVFISHLFGHSSGYQPFSSTHVYPPSFLNPTKTVTPRPSDSTALQLQCDYALIPEKIFGPDGEDLVWRALRDDASLGKLHLRI